ncbi:unnamed protein product [Oikopleura dioica]|uniref:Uncharacterized protein n=1 Tax=Oikopleura dioica TaxID=34765 RepID=E4YX70_OIKDI|nr:unnamed protein product [Oikopleura dioica]
MQLRAIKTIQRVSENNRVCSTALINLGAARNLQIVLDQTKSQLDVKASTLEALWTLSGGELGEQKAIATLIGEPLLISILQDTPLNNTNDTHTLHKVATEALGVLCRGPESRQKEVLEADSAKVLMTIIRSKDPQVVIDVLRTLSLLCVSSGLVPNTLAQKTVARAASGSSSTIRLLLNLLIHSNSDSVSVNAAFTLACLTLGNKTTMKELQADPDWSFLLVVKLYYSNDIKVQLHAAAAFSVFCFNSSQNISAIRQCIDGLTGESIDDLLNSDVVAYRYDAAFHQVVLAKSIEDRDPALLAAAGVKILIEGANKATEAKDSYDVELAAAATNHIAALIRLKGSGVANGLISIGVCEVLYDVLASPLMSETGRDGAATALGFLTMMPEACRIILKEIRVRPFVAHMLMHHAKPKSLSDEFRERWKTFRV